MKKNRLILMLCILCALSLAVMAAALHRDFHAQFTPPPFDLAAQSGTPDVPMGSGYQILDPGVFRVGLCGEVWIRSGAADIWLTNPADNKVWLKLRVLDGNGRILGQTGLLRPGEYVRQVMLSDTAPGTPIILKVMAYEPESYHSAGALRFHTVIGAE